MDNINTYTEQYMEKIFYFCLKRTGNLSDAEDLTSDISLNVIQQLRNEISIQNFSAYIWKIARNRYSVWVDNKHKKSGLFLNSDISDFELSAENNIENEYVKSEELSLLRRELAFISTEYRNILVAFYIENCSINQIATKLGLTNEAVKMRLFRVRNILKEGMSMAREFGKKSYNPEDIEFLASGNQPTGLPWKAVERKIPKNILIQADNNPSTIEELSMELGISAPYMEEEVELLEKATLLKRIGNKYVTNFFIESKECQIEVYNVLKKLSKEKSDLINKITNEILDDIKAYNIVRNGMSDNDIKWWLYIHIADFLIVEAVDDPQIHSPEVRENGENWGFVGYEKIELPEKLAVGHNGNGNGAIMFWSYKINDYGMCNRVGEMTYPQTILLADIIANNRNIKSLTKSEKDIWDKINGRFAHNDENGYVIPDILVFENKVMQKIDKIIKNHNLFNKALIISKTQFENIITILSNNSSKILEKQLTYCAAMEMCKTRMLVIHDLVESGILIVPENPNQSTVAMGIEI